MWIYIKVFIEWEKRSRQKLTSERFIIIYYHSIMMFTFVRAEVTQVREHIMRRWRGRQLSPPVLTTSRTHSPDRASLPLTTTGSKPSSGRQSNRLSAQKNPFISESITSAIHLPATSSLIDL